jgi:guanylate kinase
VQGVDNFRKVAKTTPLLAQRMATIFINVNLQELRQRMIGRGHDGDAEILRRLQTAERELQEGHRFDFRIESRSRDEDFQELLAIWKKVQRRLQNR